MATFFDTLSHAFRAFTNRDPTPMNLGVGQSSSPTARRSRRSSISKSIIPAILNRFSVDAAANVFRHVETKDGRYSREKESELNVALNLSANIDQTGRAMIMDAVYSMLDEGSVAIVPVSFEKDSEDEYKDIDSLRVGKITQWFPQHVQVRLYDERDGQYKDVTIPKKDVALPENPFYEVMNRPNSIVQRLDHKFYLLDQLDEKTNSGKLDIIVQFPYGTNSPRRKAIAEQRRKDIEVQLENGKYGIAYMDGAEKITQLNRPVENNLLAQIEHLQALMFGQFSISEAILNGTAPEAEMQAYMARILEPILSEIADEMTRKFISEDDLMDGDKIMFFKDPFKLVPISQIGQIAKDLITNEMATPNEMRAVIGWKPSTDDRADTLQNRNINVQEPLPEEEYPEEEYPEEEVENQNDTNVT